MLVDMPFSHRTTPGNDPVPMQRVLVGLNADSSSCDSSLTEIAPTAAIVTPRLGTVSEVWVEGQAAGFRRVKPCRPL
jgi:hypothetical protein